MLVFTMVNVLRFVDVTTTTCQLEFVLYLLNIFYCGDILLDYQSYYLQIQKKDLAFIMVLKNLDGKNNLYFIKLDVYNIYFIWV
jgi:hypothetical protein